MSTQATRQQPPEALPKITDPDREASVYWFSDFPSDNPDYCLRAGAAFGEQYIGYLRAHWVREGADGLILRRIVKEMFQAQPNVGANSANAGYVAGFCRALEQALIDVSEPKP